MDSRISTGLALPVAALLVVLSLPATAAPPCPLTLRPPVPGEVVRPFKPVRAGGHFGVDLASPRSALVRAPISGTVTFAGRVAGMRSVTIAVGGSVRISLSHLSEVWVRAGQRVQMGGLLGRSGTDHGRAAVHLSVRVAGRYIDPQPALKCGARPAATRWGLRLLPPRSVLKRVRLTSGRLPVEVEAIPSLSSSACSSGPTGLNCRIVLQVR